VNAQWANLGAGCLNLCVSLLGPWLMATCNRRTLMMFSCALCSIFLFTIAFVLFYIVSLLTHSDLFEGKLKLSHKTSSTLLVIISYPILQPCKGCCDCRQKFAMPGRKLVYKIERYRSKAFSKVFFPLHIGQLYSIEPIGVVGNIIARNSSLILIKVSYVKISEFQFFFNRLTISNS